MKILKSEADYHDNPTSFERLSAEIWMFYETSEFLVLLARWDLSELRGILSDFKGTGMGTIKDNMAKLKCSACSRITHYTKRNKKKVKEKLSLSKYCRFCKKNTTHTESK